MPVNLCSKVLKMNPTRSSEPNGGADFSGCFSLENQSLGQIVLISNTSINACIRVCSYKGVPRPLTSLKCSSFGGLEAHCISVQAGRA